MENKEKPIFIGSGKQTNDKYINGSICLDDIPQEDITASQKNNKRYVNVTIGKKAETDQWGKTHYISINRWQPDPNKKRSGTLAEHNDYTGEQNVPF